MTPLCVPSFHRGRRACGKLFEEVGHPSPSYPQPVVHSRLPACSQSGCAQRRPPRTVAAPTAIAGEVRRTPWSAGRGVRGGPHRGRGRRGRASRSRATTTDPTAAGGGPLRSAGDPVVRGRRDSRVQNVATLVGGPAVRVNGEKASGAMRRRTGICAPAVGRGFAGMRGGAQGGRSEWAFRRRSKSKGSAGMRGGSGPHGLTCAAMDGVGGDSLWGTRANGRPLLRHRPRERPSRPPASPAGPRGPPGAPPRPRSHPPRRRRAGPAAPRRRRRTRPRRSADRPGAPARRSRTRGRR